MKQLQTIIKKYNPVQTTITLSTKTPDQYIKELKDKDIYLETGIEEMIQTLTPFKIEEELDIIILSVQQLGFDETWVTLKDIYKKAQDLGLELLPQNAGIELRLQYEQPNSDWFRVATEPIRLDGGLLRLWGVLRHGDGERWLRWNYGKPGLEWSAGNQFAFRFRKSELETSETENSLESLTLNRAIEICKENNLVVYKIL